MCSTEITELKAGMYLRFNNLTSTAGKSKTMKWQDCKLKTLENKTEKTHVSTITSNNIETFVQHHV